MLLVALVGVPTSLLEEEEEQEDAEEEEEDEEVEEDEEAGAILEERDEEELQDDEALEDVEQLVTAFPSVEILRSFLLPFRQCFAAARYNTVRFVVHIDAVEGR